MNFLPATSSRNGEWDVAGMVLEGPRNQQALQFAIRPEDLKLCGVAENLNEQAENSVLSATVRVIEPLGSHKLASCKVADVLFRVMLDNDSTVIVGDVLLLKPLPDRVRWFDPSSSQAVT